MTSTARTCKIRAGFTLLEIIMVLAIATMVMGGALGFMVYSSDERALRNASGEIELMAKRARTTAILKQTPYALEFRLGVARLLPLAEAGQDEKTTVGGRRIGGEPVIPAGGEHRQYVLPAGVDVYVRRWNSTEWLLTGKKSIHVWRFDPTGLCEPLAVRLTLNKSWSEDTYHPLTATICDRQFEVR